MNRIEELVVSLILKNEQFVRTAKESLDTVYDLRDGIDSVAENTGDILSKGTKVAGKAMSAMSDAASDALDFLQKKFSVVGREIMRIQDSIMRKLTGMLTGGWNQILSGGSRRALNIEQAKFQFAGLNMDVEEAMKNALAAVKGTAYGLDEAARAASQLGSSGVALGDDMTTALTAISGVAAMTSSSYDDISNIFIKVAGNGRLMSEQLMMLSGRGINAAATLAQQMGITEAEVREMTSKGEIDFATFSKAMYDAFGEHAKDANKTFTGAVSNMRAALSRVGADYATPLYEHLKNLANLMIPLIDSVHAAFEPLMRTDIVRVMGEIAAWVANIITKVRPITSVLKSIYGIARSIITVIWNFLNPFVRAIKDSILVKMLQKVQRIFHDIDAFFKTDKIQLSAATIEGIYNFVYRIGQVLNRIINYSLVVISKTVGPLLNFIFESVDKFFSIFANWKTLKDAWGPILGEEEFERFHTNVYAMQKAVEHFFQNVQTTARNVWMALGRSEAFKKLTTAVLTLEQNLLHLLYGAANEFTSWLGGQHLRLDFADRLFVAFEKISGILTSIVNGVAQMLSMTFDPLAGIARMIFGILNGVADIIGFIFVDSNLIDNVASMLTAIMNFIGTFTQGIMSALGAFLAWFDTDFFAGPVKIIEDAIQVVSNVIGHVAELVNGIATSYGMKIFLLGITAVSDALGNLINTVLRPLIRILGWLFDINLDENNILSQVVAFFTSDILGIAGTVLRILSSVITIITDIIQALTGKISLSEAIKHISDVLYVTWPDIVNVVTEIYNHIVAVITNVKNAITSFVTWLSDVFAPSLWNGILSVKDKIVHGFSDAIYAIGEFFGVDRDTMRNISSQDRQLRESADKRDQIAKKIEGTNKILDTAEMDIAHEYGLISLGDVISALFDLSAVDIGVGFAHATANIVKAITEFKDTIVTHVKDFFSFKWLYDRFSEENVSLPNMFDTSNLVLKLLGAFGIDQSRLQTVMKEQRLARKAAEGESDILDGIEETADQVSQLLPLPEVDEPVPPVIEEELFSISEIVSGILTIVQQTINKKIDDFKQKVTHAVVSLFTGKWLRNAFTKGATWLGEFLNNDWGSIISTMVTTVETYFSNSLDAITSVISGAWTAIYNWVKAKIIKLLPGGNILSFIFNTIFGSNSGRAEAKKGEQAAAYAGGVLDSFFESVEMSTAPLDEWYGIDWASVKTSVMSALMNFATSLVNSFLSAREYIRNVLPPAVVGVIDTIDHFLLENVFAKIKETVVSWFLNIGTWFTSIDWKNIPVSMAAAVTNLWLSLKDAFQIAKEYIRNKIPDSVKAIFETLYNYLASDISTTFNAIVNSAGILLSQFDWSGIKTSIIDGLTKLSSAIAGAIEIGKNYVKDILAEKYLGIVGIIGKFLSSEFMQNLITSFDFFKASIEAFDVTQLGTSLLNLVVALGNSVVTAAKFVYKYLKDKITTKITALTESVTTFFSKEVWINFATKFMEFATNVKVFDWSQIKASFIQMAAALGIAIGESAKAVKTYLYNKIPAPIKTIFETFKKFLFGNVVEEANGDLTDAVVSATSVLASFDWNGIKERVVTFLTKIAAGIGSGIVVAKNYIRSKLPNSVNVLLDTLTNFITKGIGETIRDKIASVIDTLSTLSIPRLKEQFFEYIRNIILAFTGPTIVDKLLAFHSLPAKTQVIVKKIYEFLETGVGAKIVDAVTQFVTGLRTHDWTNVKLGLMDLFKALWTATINGLKAAKNYILEHLPAPVASFVDTVQKYLSSDIPNAITSAANVAMDFLSKQMSKFDWEPIKESVTTFLTNLGISIDWAISAAMGFLDSKMPKTVKVLFGVIKNFIGEELWEKIKKNTVTAFTTISTFDWSKPKDALVESLKALGTSIVESIKIAWAYIYNTLPEGVQSFVDKVKNFVATGFFNNIVSNVGHVIEKFYQWGGWERVTSVANEFLTKLGTAIVNAAKLAWGFIRSKLPPQVNTLIDTIAKFLSSDILDKAATTISASFVKVVNWFRTFDWTDIRDSVSTFFTGLGSALGDAIKIAWEYIRSKLPKNIQTLIDTISNMLFKSNKDVEEAVAGMEMVSLPTLYGNNTIYGEITTMMFGDESEQEKKTFAEKVRDFVDFIGSKMQAIWEALKYWAGELVAKGKEFFDIAIPWLKTKFNSLKEWIASINWGSVILGSIGVGVTRSLWGLGTFLSSLGDAMGGQNGLGAIIVKSITWEKILAVAAGISGIIIAIVWAVTQLSEIPTNKFNSVTSKLSDILIIIGVFGTIIFAIFAVWSYFNNKQTKPIESEDKKIEQITNAAKSIVKNSSESITDLIKTIVKEFKFIEQAGKALSSSIAAALTPLAKVADAVKMVAFGEVFVKITDSIIKLSKIPMTADTVFATGAVMTYTLIALGLVSRTGEEAKKKGVSPMAILASAALLLALGKFMDTITEVIRKLFVLLALNPTAEFHAFMQVIVATVGVFGGIYGLLRTIKKYELTANSLIGLGLIFIGLGYAIDSIFGTVRSLVKLTGTGVTEDQIGSATTLVLAVAVFLGVFASAMAWVDGKVNASGQSMAGMAVMLIGLGISLGFLAFAVDAIAVIGAIPGADIEKASEVLQKSIIAIGIAAALIAIATGEMQFKVGSGAGAYSGKAINIVASSSVILALGVAVTLLAFPIGGLAMLGTIVTPDAIDKAVDVVTSAITCLGVCVIFIAVATGQISLKSGGYSGNGISLVASAGVIAALGIAGTLLAFAIGALGIIGMIPGGTKGLETAKNVITSAIGVIALCIVFIAVATGEISIKGKFNYSGKGVNLAASSGVILAIAGAVTLLSLVIIAITVVAMIPGAESAISTASSIVDLLIIFVGGMAGLIAYLSKDAKGSTIKSSAGVILALGAAVLILTVAIGLICVLSTLFTDTQLYTAAGIVAGLVIVVGIMAYLAGKANQLETLGPAALFLALGVAAAVLVWAISQLVPLIQTDSDAVLTAVWDVVVILVVLGVVATAASVLVGKFGSVGGSLGVMADVLAAAGGIWLVVQALGDIVKLVGTGEQYVTAIETLKTIFLMMAGLVGIGAVGGAGAAIGALSFVEVAASFWLVVNGIKGLLETLKYVDQYGHDIGHGAGAGLFYIGVGLLEGIVDGLVYAVEHAAAAFDWFWKQIRNLRGQSEEGTYQWLSEQLNNPYGWMGGTFWNDMLKSREAATATALDPSLGADTLRSQLDLMMADMLDKFFAGGITEIDQSVIDMLVEIGTYVNEKGEQVQAYTQSEILRWIEDYARSQGENPLTVGVGAPFKIEWELVETENGEQVRHFFISEADSTFQNDVKPAVEKFEQDFNAEVNKAGEGMQESVNNNVPDWSVPFADLDTPESLGDIKGKLLEGVDDVNTAVSSEMQQGGQDAVDSWSTGLQTQQQTHDIANELFDTFAPGALTFLGDQGLTFMMGGDDTATKYVQGLRSGLNTLLTLSDISQLTGFLNFSENSNNAFLSEGTENMNSLITGMNSEVDALVASVAADIGMSVDEARKYIPAFEATGFELGQSEISGYNATEQNMIGLVAKLHLAGITTAESFNDTFYTTGYNNLMRLIFGAESTEDQWLTTVSTMMTDGHLEIESFKEPLYYLGRLLLTNLKDGASSQTEAYKTVVRTLVQAGYITADSLKGEYYATGANLGRGFAGGIRSIISESNGAAHGMALGALHTMRNVLQERSPSRATAQIGSYFVLGFTNKLESMTETVREAASSVGLVAVTAFDESLMSGLDDAGILTPTVAPVFDMSSIDALRMPQFTIDTSRVALAGEGMLDYAASQQNGASVVFNQYNNSPKALSAIEIYRRTRNQISQLKGASL